MTRCVEVNGGGGGDSLIDQWQCDVSSITQLNQTWQFASAPLPEVTTHAGDGQRTTAGTTNNRMGILIGTGGAGFCSATSIESASGSKDWLITARHCVDNYSGQMVFKAKYDARTSPTCTAYYYVDQILLVPSPGGAPQDTAFLKLGGSYSCANNSWVGHRVHDDVGYFNFKWGQAPANAALFTYGYPVNLGRQQIPVACASQFTAGGLPNTMYLYCESSHGNSGSGWISWNTNDLYATSNGVLTRLLTWCGVSPCTTVAVPVAQQHYWHTAGTNAYWSATT